ncbi:membrane protein insertase YidC [Parerythrobacter jejuensis]|uniref:Membrane protein insertase YidC n=1 Tax=Parerythrobacter jejuensis TaxID=795812 RepID=A0A845AUU5_9SPHN|nr:membrane protein insertase YidC [Parerythrobacter jejuensis]MXP30509.1 membrane protein insertase YidC [Parerythrobacter jejuensis]MXP33269.1 membrane protein insertase YidC [Parerythrobacter jejuensis]
MENQRNLLLAVVLCGLLIIGWDAAMNQFYPQPAKPVQAAQTQTAPGGAPQASASGTATLEAGTAGAAEAVDLAAALASPQRVSIDAPRVKGSINLVGARVDDIELKDHRATIDEDSGPVQLFSPQGTEGQQFAQFGWVGEGVALPGADTVWTADGEGLTQDTPVTLSWDNGAGLQFRIKFSIDDNYMITAEQTAANTGEGSVVARPFATVTRTSKNASTDTWIAHSGPMGVFGDSADYGPDYDDLADEGSATPEGRTHWIGFSDIYWLGALVPQKDTDPQTGFRALGPDVFRADVIYQPATIASGNEVIRTTRLFAGGKESVVLDAYEDAGIEKFGLAIDWGWFRWFEKPLLWLLNQLFELVGNFGVAIILLTVIIRGLLFPIAQKQFASMAAMKAVQPKMKAIQERYKDDKPKQQQEIMALYKEEKVNPLAGCLPLLIQIPIFFALYKVLILAIEMRHQPFFGWLQDLSAPDPAHIFNLFGLLPFEVPALIAIGPLAVLLGITMWLTFQMNPIADPIQRQIFNIMPWVLMFIMAPFAAGLLLYWNTSNVLTLAQQKYLYSRHPQLKAAAEAEKAEKAKAQEG